MFVAGVDRHSDWPVSFGDAMATGLYAGEVYDEDTPLWLFPGNLRDAGGEFFESAAAGGGNCSALGHNRLSAAPGVPGPDHRRPGYHEEAVRLSPPLSFRRSPLSLSLTHTCTLPPPPRSLMANKLFMIDSASSSVLREGGELRPLVLVSFAHMIMYYLQRVKGR